MDGDIQEVPGGIQALLAFTTFLTDVDSQCPNFGLLDAIDV